MSVDYFKTARELVQFQAGDIIFDENQPGDVMYAVREGSVEIQHNGHILEVCEVGQFFGEMALIDSEYRAARAVAKTNCTLAKVDKHRFTFLVQETPTFALQVMHTMANRLRRQTRATN